MSPMDIPRVSRGDKHPRISLSKGKEILILSPAAIYDRHPVSGLNATQVDEKLATHSFLPSSLSSFVREIRQDQQVHRTTINEAERDMIIDQRNGVTADWITRSRVEPGESRESKVERAKRRILLLLIGEKMP